MSEQWQVKSNGFWLGIYDVGLAEIIADRIKSKTHAHLIAAAPDMAERIAELEAQRAALLEVVQGVNDFLGSGEYIIVRKDGDPVLPGDELLAQKITQSGRDLLASANVTIENTKGMT